MTHQSETPQRTTTIPPAICEYCSKPFAAAGDPAVKTDLKVKFKNQEHLITIVVCPSCVGQLAQYNGEMPEGAIQLYKISKYKFPKEKKQKREDNSLLVFDSKKPLWEKKKI